MDAITSIASDPIDITSALAPAALAMKMGGPANMAQIDKTAKDFEAMFATQMLKPMFDTVPVNPLFGGGNGEEVMKTFLLQEYGKLIAKAGTLGIANHVKTEMLRAQEGGASRSPTNLGKTAYAQPITPATGAGYVTN